MDKILIAVLLSIPASIAILLFRDWLVLAIASRTEEIKRECMVMGERKRPYPPTMPPAKPRKLVVHVKQIH